MTNYENLKGKGFESRSTDELREIQSKGGRASGEARRKKANFRKTLNQLLTAEIDSPEWTPLLKSLGLDSTLESALNMAMIKRGLLGDVKAYEAVAKYAGQATGTDVDLEEQRIRTDRAKRARDVEIGTAGSSEDCIRSFLKAMSPTQDDIDSLFAEVDEYAEGTKETAGF